MDLKNGESSSHALSAGQHGRAAALVGGIGKLLGKRRALAERRALPVDDVDGADQQHGDGEEDGSGRGDFAAGRANV